MFNNKLFSYTDVVLNHKILRAIVIMMLLPATFISCKKSTGDEPEPEEETVITGVYTLSNIAADTLATSGSLAKPLYFSLEEKKVVSSSLLQTDKWDIAFTGTYNSNIAINNGSGALSPGFGGPGKGAIYLQVYPELDASYYDAPNKPIKSIPAKSLVDEAFNKVKTAPEDSKMLTNKIIGLDYFSNSEDGWAYYDFYGQVFPDQPADTVGHVSYTLPRPVIIKTAKGNYAKIIVYSVYKGAPEIPSRSYKPGYITFKYAIQKNGSKNLDIN